MSIRKASLPKPTPTELQILNILWQTGPSTVRSVYEQMDAHGDVGYTTVLKLMQIMWEKGLLTREEQGRAHLYMPAQAKEQTQSQMVTDLMERVFSGSAAQLVQRALASRAASREELTEIRSLLDELEGKAKGERR